MGRRKQVLVMVVAVLAGVAAGGAWVLLRPHQAAPARSSDAALSVFPPQVRVPGAIRARQVVPVAATVQGTLEQVMVEPGQEVVEGQILARIHNGGLEAAREAAQADLERAESRARSLESALMAARLEASRARANADRIRTEFEKIERNFQRQQFLWQEGAIAKLAFEKARKEYELARQDKESIEEMARLADDRLASLTKELDAARASLEEKRAALEEAVANLAAAEVHAPVDGVLVARKRQVGDPVGPHVPDLFEIAVDLSTLEVVVEPEPGLLARIQPGQAVVVEVTEGPLGGLPGRVLKIEEGRVIVEFANPSPAVKPGMDAQVRFQLGPPSAGR